MPAPPLVDLTVDEGERQELREASRDWLSHTLTPRQLCDLELLATGGFSPLRGFMTRVDYTSCCERLRLASGAVWPVPITLDVPEHLARELQPGSRIALRDPEGVMLAALRVDDVWEPNRRDEAEAVFATVDDAHPGVHHLLHRTHAWYVGGPLEVLTLPTHYDFRELRLTPRQVRAEFQRRGWDCVVAFQTRNPMHRAHVEVTRRAAEVVGGHLFLHPVVGQTKPGDIDYFTRVRCYRAVLPRYQDRATVLGLLPLAMRMAGPREALWHGLIRKNFGCSHFIVGRDHASPGKNASGAHFYGRYAAQDLFRRFEQEIGMNMVAFERLLYAPDLGSYVAESEVKKGARTLTISGTEFRERLRRGESIPEWFSYPEVVLELRRSHPPRRDQGLTLFLTGLSGAGKSTLANILTVRLRERGDRKVTLLDGDLVRQHLSSELGFSAEDRDRNIDRITFVAGEVTRHGGVAICAPIAPYDAARQRARAHIGALGGFVLVHVAASLEVCEARDRKGLYAKARAGLIPDFTGVSDRYEIPTDADVVVDTGALSAEAAANQVLEYLTRDGYLKVSGS